ncbi:hypothetical protein C7M84_007344 [Penaeus vannamei]|uniref:Uncharacterized protein n=1 Tax=Penaeus vannamei TaxID=6689 RepID=A0A423TCE1_PENVA|nr:hypothetical protein C7M84_007344 [Penaeus vannamei]
MIFSSTAKMECLPAEDAFPLSWVLPFLSTSLPSPTLPSFPTSLPPSSPSSMRSSSLFPTSSPPPLSFYPLQVPGHPPFPASRPFPSPHPCVLSLLKEPPSLSSLPHYLSHSTPYHVPSLPSAPFLPASSSNPFLPFPYPPSHPHQFVHPYRRRPSLPSFPPTVHCHPPLSPPLPPLLSSPLSMHHLHSLRTLFPSPTLLPSLVHASFSPPIDVPSPPLFPPSLLPSLLSLLPSPPSLLPSPTIQVTPPPFPFPLSHPHPPSVPGAARGASVSLRDTLPSCGTQSQPTLPLPLPLLSPAPLLPCPLFPPCILALSCSFSLLPISVHDTLLPIDECNEFKHALNNTDAASSTEQTPPVVMATGNVPYCTQGDGNGSWHKIS